jgi:hypothetical protein
MIESVKDQQTPATDAIPVNSLGRFPMWKRGFALLWVISLCGLFGFLGLLLAGSFTSFSGY